MFKTSSKNKTNSLLIVSSFPLKNEIHGSKTVGVAFYAKNTLINLKKVDKDLEITVFADILNAKENYIDNGLLVNRLWKRGSFISLFLLYLNILKHPSKKFILQFEMFMLGNLFSTVFFLLLLSSARLFKKELIIVLHQVVSDVGVFETDKLKRWVFSLFKPVFYKYLILISTKIIVFEQALKDRLSSKKVFVIPLAVLDLEIFDKKFSINKLGLDFNKKYVLFFGYLSPYKGILELLNSFDTNSKYSLILGGGINPNYNKDPKFLTYIDKIKKIAESKKVLITGFIDEKDIPFYFCSCDLVVLPYKEFMSSSGPLSLSVSYEKPFLISKNLDPYFKTADFKKALFDSKIPQKDFYLNFNNLEESFDFCTKNSDNFKNFVRSLKEQRSWNKISKEYLNII